MSDKKIQQQIRKQLKKPPTPKGVSPTPPFVRAAEEAARKENRRNKRTGGK